MSRINRRQQKQQKRQEQEEQEQEKAAQWRQAAQAEYQRLYALPLPDLAAEIMQKAFGPGGPGYDDDTITVDGLRGSEGPTVSEITGLFVPYGSPIKISLLVPEGFFLRDQITKLVAEGLQQLEHVALVRCQIHSEGSSGFDWAATRRGRAALDRGQVQAILLHGDG
jgi:hypothetical protein